MSKQVSHDPNDVIDYWLDISKQNSVDGDTVVSAVWDVPSPLVKNNQAETSKRSTVFITGGVVGNTYKATCQVTTALGRKITGSILLYVEEK